MRLITPQEWRPEGIEDLEPNAWGALRSPDSICVIAGPGAGKTEFLAQKATYLLQTGICPYPRQILAISFKKDAAENLKKRVEKRCPDEQRRRFHSMTFDAFSKSVVDRFRMALSSYWRPTENAEIIFPDRRFVESFLRGLPSSPYRQAALNLDAQHFERDYIARKLLASREVGSDPPVIDEVSFARLEWWRTNLRGSARSKLSFAMINRLAELILRENPFIREALRATYKFVFLDEYQDATNAQYQLIKTAFWGSSTKLTSVGDDKQRIMGWADARNNIFDDFCADYSGTRTELLFNHRSIPELVVIQYAIARQINPNAGSPVSRATRNISGSASGIWEFPNRAAEILSIASWIEGELGRGILTPRDFAILVRNRPENIVPEFLTEFSTRGLTLRNEARDLGRILIQDLLSEELTKILLPLFRLGASLRDPESWVAIVEILTSLEGLAPEDAVGLEDLENRLSEFLVNLRGEMLTAPTVPSALDILQRCLNFVGRDLVCQAFLHYRQQDQFDRVYEGFATLLEESVADSANWNEVIDKFVGIGQIPVMTVHKSKGLEFHTVLFVGLDDRSWWSFGPNSVDEMSAFFVAFSRAKQRAFFSYCAERGTNRNFAALYDLLRNAGLAISSGIPAAEFA